MMIHFNPVTLISQVAIAILAFAALLILYLIVHYRFFRPLSTFPGPFWVSVMRLWIAYHEFKGNEPYTMWNEVQKRGKSLRLSSSHADPSTSIDLSFWFALALSG